MTADNASQIDQNTIRLVLLPKYNSSISSYTTISLKDPTNDGESRQFLVSQPENKLYSLNKTDFKDQYKEKQKVTKNGQPIKSLMLTTTTKSNCLIIGKTPEIYVGTIFNQIYFLLSFFVQFLRQDHLRLLSYDDLCEMFEDSESLGSLIKMKISFKESLETICETVRENGETFYKVSEARILDYINQRVDRIFEHFPCSLKSQLLRKLQRVNNLVPSTEVIKLSHINASIDLLSSFVDKYYLNKVRARYDFGPLIEYHEKLAQMEEMNKVAEDNLERLNEKLQNNGSSKRKRKQIGTKKVVKRIAVGKGALDMFFGKNK
ncbi:hypothetical protein FOA43_001360 [Brettanomyces nanus]|uniref:Ribonuclease H2 subunit B wHTH domain-containing protein n=1 Tax=Eeniella nana TaxID=13502 RepID=A0A875RX82_EENNA|nr:uncharacterized protein FOA43_001360 [Brettanomyces nanus]QPG74041.1 hypothetical protein FOA43_001360 [Brettanomyces nanus]